jgi:electron transfer flavoprotein beta subunit
MNHGACPLNVIVCVKRVPDTETRIKIGEGGKSIDDTGVKFILSPYDEYAVEAALRTTEGAGEGEVTLITFGGEASQETLRAGLAMGADKALLLEGESGMDGLSTAKALVAELEAADAPLILFGVKAADGDQQQVGPMVGTLLGRACVTGVTQFDVQDGKVVCHREVEGGVEVVEADLPAVVSITKGEYEPRYASLKGIMAAKRKPLDKKAASVSADRMNVVQLSEPPARAAGKIVGEGAEAAPELVRLLREEANAL